MVSILRRILGPASKYDERLPYTYEARVRDPAIPGTVDSVICDTLCGLLERLGDEGIDPGEATLLEIRPGGEFPVLTAHCLDARGQWLRRPAACAAFAAHYVGHEAHGRCCYRDRSREADGPFETGA